MKKYVLISQGIPIYRTTNKKDAEKIMNDANNDWYRCMKECIKNNEPYDDNYLEMFEEEYFDNEFPSSGNHIPYID